MRSFSKFVINSTAYVIHKDIFPSDICVFFPLPVFDECILLCSVSVVSDSHRLTACQSSCSFDKCIHQCKQEKEQDNFSLLECQKRLKGSSTELHRSLFQTPFLPTACVASTNLPPEHTLFCISSQIISNISGSSPCISQIAFVKLKLAEHFILLETNKRY